MGAWWNGPYDCEAVVTGMETSRGHREARKAGQQIVQRREALTMSFLGEPAPACTDTGQPTGQVGTAIVIAHAA